jgi:hypothetical protein
MEQVVAHAIRNHRWDLRPAGSVEVRHRISAVLAPQRRKLIADRLDRRDV